MNDIYERFIELRKTKKLSQTEFGKRVGVSRGVINNIERKLVEPKDLFIRQVCKEYHVNYLWLTEGEGDMLLNDENFLLDELSEDYNLDDFDKKIIKSYISLNHDDRMALKRILNDILKE